MFGLFKKTSWKIEGKAFDFFHKVFSQLPNEFIFLSDGLNKGVYKRFLVNHAIKGHHYSVSFDPLQSDRSMVKGKDFVLENILIIQKDQKFPLTISIYEGLWVDFEIEKNIIDFGNFEVDLSKFCKIESKFAKENNLVKLVSGLYSDKLELDNLSEFDIEGINYYQIKDLEDGNYIAIDKKGQVFGLIHSPYKIDLINKSVANFVDDVNNGRFDFDKYLNENNGYL